REDMGLSFLPARHRGGRHYRRDRPRTATPPGSVRVVAASYGVTSRTLTPREACAKLGRDLVQAVEGIVQRHAPHAAEPRLRAQLPDLGLVETRRAQPLTAVRQRRGQAVEHAGAVEEGA